MQFMKCLNCGNPTRSDNKRSLCMTCLKVCECGKKKDRRATLCVSCASKIKARINWDNPTCREKSLDAMRKSAKSRAGTKKYQVITFDMFSPRKSDGRFVLRYQHLNKSYYKYRYVWVWEQTYGVVPEGHCLHHKNHDCADDRLENLELMTISDHAKLHGAIHRKNRPIARCKQCNKEFWQRKSHGKLRIFCSQTCCKKTQIENATYEWKTKPRISRTDQRFAR